MYRGTSNYNNHNGHDNYILETSIDSGLIIYESLIDRINIIFNDSNVIDYDVVTKFNIYNKRLVCLKYDSGYAKDRVLLEYDHFVKNNIPYTMVFESSIKSNIHFWNLFAPIRLYLYLFIQAYFLNFFPLDYVLSLKLEIPIYQIQMDQDCNIISYQLDAPFPSDDIENTSQFKLNDIQVTSETTLIPEIRSLISLL